MSRNRFRSVWGTNLGNKLGFLVLRLLNQLKIDFLVSKVISKSDFQKLIKRKKVNRKKYFKPVLATKRLVYLKIKYRKSSTDKLLITILKLMHHDAASVMLTWSSWKCHNFVIQFWVEILPKGVPGETAA